MAFKGDTEFVGKTIWVEDTLSFYAGKKAVIEEWVRDSVARVHLEASPNITFCLHISKIGWKPNV
jgi:hypothetical protein